jgi:hypothetical protein
MHNLNRAADLARGYGVKRFVALMDSGLYIDTEPLPASKIPALHVQAKGVLDYLKANVDPACASEYPGESWKCMLGEYAVPTIKTTVPFVLHAFQADRFQLGYTDFGNWDTSAASIRANNNESAYAASWRIRTRAALAAAAKQGAAAGNSGSSTVAIHSSDCYSHCNTEGAGFSDANTVSGVSLKQVVQSFVFGTPGPTQIVDDCTGEFACGAGCKLTTAAASASTFSSALENKKDERGTL